MNCPVGLKDIEDFTNEFNDIPRKINSQPSVKQKQKLKPNPENKENEFDKGRC